MEVLMVEQKRQRTKRGAKPITYRLLPEVLHAVRLSASRYGRSDNQQAEFLLKIGFLHSQGVKVSSLSDPEILEAFETTSKAFDLEADEE